MNRVFSMVFQSLRIVLPIFVVFLSFSYSAYSQNSINGMVFDDKRQPVSNVDIELLDEFYRMIQSVRTNNGVFRFVNIPRGNYFVKVRTSGTYFKEKIEAVRDLGINNSASQGRAVGRDSQQVQIYLEPNKNGGITGENGVVFVQEVPDGAKKSFQTGMSKIEKGDVDGGILSFKEAIQTFPDYFDALMMLGNQYVKSQNFADAEPVLTKACEVNTKSSGCLEGLGFVKYRLNKNGEAVNFLEKAITNNPKSVDAYYWLGIVHRMSKNYKAAETTLKKGNEVADKKNANIHWQLALLYNDIKRYADAASELSAFLKIQPDSQDKDKILKLIEQLKEKARQ